MQLFVLAAIVYMAIGAGVVMTFRDDALSLVRELLSDVSGAVNFFLIVGWWILPVFAVLLVFGANRTYLKRLPAAVISIFACAGFFATFTMLKTSMPFISPFWADPQMAAIDRALHLGIDPWVWTHKFSAFIPAQWVNLIYMKAWLVPAMFLPTLLALFDTDRARTRRFLTLYVITWVGLGNILALGFLSAGPVYFDRLYGGDSFAALFPALETAGLLQNTTGQLIDMLWQAYQSQAQLPGSGISAFPSVHVAMATVVALYLYERHRYFALPAAAIIATYQFLSVYQGWHYAIDGYFSILFILALWVALRRRATRLKRAAKS